MHRRSIGWLAAGLLAAPAFVDCGSDDEPSRASPPDAGTDADAASPYDDDTGRLAHCDFEPAPEKSSAPAPAPGPLQAGVASAYLELPIGVPMGGYGARSTTFGGAGADMKVDDRAARFATRFIPSVGAHDTPRIDAVALEAGGEKLVLLRTDAILITETALFGIENAIASDGSMRGRVIVTASHTHASWSNWLPSFSLVPGIDTPKKELFDRAVAAHADVAKSALAKLEPARIGFAVDMNADPDSTLSHDRRGENDTIVGPDGNTAGKDKDHAVWAMRLDRADGSPLAGVLAFPLHGTRGTEENQLASSDAPGGIQRALSQALGYPVFHVQGAAGDVSPGGPAGRVACPDGKRCLDAPNLEIVGALAAETFGPMISGITTHDALALEVVTRTFYVGRAGVVTRPDGRELFYPPPGDYLPDRVVFDDDGVLATPLDEFNAAHGAALCGEAGAGIVAIPGTSGLPAYGSCNDVEKLAPTVAGLYEIPPFQTPICDTARTTASAVRFDVGDGEPLLLLTIPGEPTAPFAAYLRGRSPAGADRTLIVGYGQDYIGYVLTAEDWLAGGYEPSLNVWGPLEGEIILDGIVGAAQIAWSPEREDPESGTSRFTAFPFPPSTPVTPVVTSDHGTVPSTLPSALFLPDTTALPATAQPAPTIPRAAGIARFVWLGGDPAVDYPRVVVEREIAPGSFAPLVDALGNPATSAEGAVFLTYTPDPIADENPSHHYYAASWQAVPPDAFALGEPERPYALPLGNYRLSVTGRARAASGTVDYTVASQPFQVVAAPLASATAQRSVTSILLGALLGDAPGLRALRAGPSDQAVPLIGPWNVTVTFADTTTATATVTPNPDGTGSLSLTATEVTQATSVELRDPAGNGGSIAVTD